MDLEKAEELIQTHLSTLWTQTPISYPNILSANFAVPGQPLLPEGDSDYIAVRHEFHTSSFVTVPGSCRRTAGQIFIAAFVRKETGTRTLARYCSELVLLLEGVDLGEYPNRVRVWTMTGSVDKAFTDWYMREIAFGASFERRVL